uniref:Cell wall integrity and stress response component 1 n=1 Tax=Schistosoma japonicum TaxID=6182 RepID=C1LS12_SCHJA|nr:Cell wall integrity and stress response component 1 precursor [Schistosoma japonicum]
MMSDNLTSLLVIGAGLPRTGTTSMKRALEILLGKPCYHMMDIMLRKHEDIGKWLQLIDEVNKTSRNEVIIHDILSEILTGYASVTDIPTCGFYRELMNVYPNAKVILTIRDKTDWLSSLRHTVMPKCCDPHKQIKEEAMNVIGYSVEIDKMITGSMEYAFQKKDINFDDDELLLECFDEYNKTVKETVPSDRLLIHQFGDGWEPLCKFLNVDIPNGIDYPHANERKHMKELMKSVGKHESLEKLSDIYPEVHNARL